MPHGDMWNDMNKVTVGEPAVRSPPFVPGTNLGKVNGGCLASFKSNSAMGLASSKKISKLSSFPLH